MTTTLRLLPDEAAAKFLTSGVLEDSEPLPLTAIDQMSEPARGRPSRYDSFSTRR